MKFTLIIESGNAAFEDNFGFDEVARILRDAAKRVENGNVAQALRDVNGNKVGSYDMEVDEVEDDSPACQCVEPGCSICDIDGEA